VITASLTAATKSEFRSTKYLGEPFDRLTVLSRVDLLTKLRVDAEESRSIEGLTTLGQVLGKIPMIGISGPNLTWMMKYTWTI
jgi:hypothetical protein